MTLSYGENRFNPEFIQAVNDALDIVERYSTFHVIFFFKLFNIIFFCAASLTLRTKFSYQAAQWSVLFCDILIIAIIIADLPELQR
jgi:hypothetical protein